VAAGELTELPCSRPIIDNHGKFPVSATPSQGKFVAIASPMAVETMDSSQCEWHDEKKRN
jgi:hypothetical protein